MAGNWIGSIPIPDQSLETRERWLSGKDHDLFLRFIRRILRWIPEERPTAEDLAHDDFLMQLYITPQLAETRERSIQPAFECQTDNQTSRSLYPSSDHPTTHSGTVENTNIKPRNRSSFSNVLNHPA